MFGINSWELLVLGVLFLLLFGPDRLPEVAVQIGRLVREIRELTEGATAELTRELEAAASEAKRTEDTVKQAGDEVRTILRDAGAAPETFRRSAGETAARLEDAAAAADSAPVVASPEPAPEGDAAPPPDEDADGAAGNTGVEGA